MFYIWYILNHCCSNPNTKYFREKSNNRCNIHYIKPIISFNSYITNGLWLRKKNPPKNSNSITQFSSTSLIQLPKKKSCKNLIFCFYITFSIWIDLLCYYRMHEQKIKKIYDFLSYPAITLVCCIWYLRHTYFFYILNFKKCI